MDIYPEKYDQLELSSNEKSFLRTLSRAFENETLAYYVLHINPRKIDLGGGQAELFNLLILKEGIFLLRFIEINNLQIAKTIVEFNANQTVYGKIVDDISAKLENSRYLLDATRKLFFDLKICYVLPEIEGSEILPLLSTPIADFVKNHVIFRDTIQAIRKDGGDVIKQLLHRKNFIKEEIVNNIFQRLCPEITIARKIVLQNDQSVSVHDTSIDGSERSILSYRLDESQINIVNRIKKGDQLILACAGSGKSVLLISKCFKLASLNPSENFLITCYNRNLNNYYQWAIAQAGFLNRNVRCQTFFSLLNYLLEKNNIRKPYYSEDDSRYYDALFNVTNEALVKGRIQERFVGIFIDEIQIFKPEWYRFCFNLLKNKDPEQHFFVIAGDKSQDIKNNIKSGKAPWQGGGAPYPEFRGKTLPIDINYRNSIPINTAVDCFVTQAKSFGKSIGCDLNSDPELFLLGTSNRDGNPPQIIELNDYSNEGEARAICDAVNDLVENKGISEVDIAIILYNRRMQNLVSKFWKTSYYQILSYIRKIFCEEKREQPAVLISGETEGVTYGSRAGATITTIEGSLGLDFKAVIVAGLLPLGAHENAKKKEDFFPISEEKQDAFKRNINYLYTGCTRAKDELYVVLSAPRGESVYMDLIRDSMQKRGV